MSDYLSRKEIADLTRTPFKARQVAFLRQNGIRHYLDLSGWPVVVRSAIEETPAQGATAAPAWKSNKAA